MDKKKMQVRTVGYHEGDIQLRSDENGNRMITGQAIVYERESNPIYGMYIEVIKRGALDDADMSRVVARTNHSDASVLGTSWAGTLRMRNTDTALEYEVDIPDTVAGRDTETYMDRGDIRGSSFAFISDYESEVWIEREGQLPILEIHKIKSLHDVSPVLNPAYPDAKSRLRSYDAWQERKVQEEADRLAEEAKERKRKADSDTLLAINNHKNIKQC